LKSQQSSCNRLSAWLRDTLKQSAVIALALLASWALPLLAADKNAVTGKSEGSSSSPAPLPLKENLSLDLGNGVALDMILIHPGTFTMGTLDTRVRPDVRPARQVQITKPFYLGKYEVTQAQYEAMTGQNPSQFPGTNRPVDSVSWNAAVGFCKQLRVKSGRNVRLPTEAERQYASRAGTQTWFYWGDDTNLVSCVDYAWSRINSDKQTHEVGLKKPNAWGLYDMAGNVCEWVSDFYNEKGFYELDGKILSCVDPQGTSSGEKHILSGGSWKDTAQAHFYCFRHKLGPDGKSDRTGFRIALDP
jgi:formylglycine-generating enzyme required for sulfatase activity